MPYQLGPDGKPILGSDGHPIPAKQGIVEAKMEPVQHKRTDAAGGASAEGEAIGTLLDCPACSSTPCACKKGG